MPSCRLPNRGAVCVCLSQGGYSFGGSVWNEFLPYDPVVEQVRWLVGGVGRARRFTPLFVDMFGPAVDGGTLGPQELEFPYESQHSSKFMYQHLLDTKGAHA